MIEILKKLCEIPTAPGMEKGILDYIKENHIKGLKSLSDGMGNLTIAKKCGRENAKKILLCAKVDFDGLIVNYIEDNGCLRVTRLGSPSAVSMAYSEVVSDKGVCGFVVPEKGADVKDADTAKLYVDIGAKSKEEAETLVTLGDIFARIPTFTELCGTRLGGSGAASRAPMAILLDTLANESFDNIDLYFSFNVQESLMYRGSKTAAFDIQPDFCIYIDICESFDIIGANKRGEAVLGDGAVILAKTSDFCVNPALRERFEDTAKNANITYKTCVYPEKSTGAAFISACGKGVACAALAIPARNIGSGAEIFDAKDAKNVKHLIFETVKTFGV